jgi:hypothetical protein
MQLARSIHTSPSSAMLQLYEVDPFIAALAFADGSGFNTNHHHLPEFSTGLRSPAASPTILPVSPKDHVDNVLEFQRNFRYDLTVIACASCGVTSFDDDAEAITLLSSAGSVFRVHEAHPLFEKYTGILNGPFPSDIQYYTVHIHQEPGRPDTFYHLHSDLLVEATQSTLCNDKVIHLCDECRDACNKKRPMLPFFNPAHGYDFGKIPVAEGSDVYKYPFNLTLAEQIVCAKCITQQTHVKFSSTEEIGVQGHMVCFKKKWQTSPET